MNYFIGSLISIIVIESIILCLFIKERKRGNLVVIPRRKETVREILKERKKETEEKIDNFIKEAETLDPEEKFQRYRDRLAELEKMKEGRKKRNGI